jgi:hypothetical protein
MRTFILHGATTAMSFHPWDLRQIKPFISTQFFVWEVILCLERRAPTVVYRLLKAPHEAKGFPKQGHLTSDGIAKQRIECCR